MTKGNQEQLGQPVKGQSTTFKVVDDVGPWQNQDPDTLKQWGDMLGIKSFPGPSRIWYHYCQHLRRVSMKEFPEGWTQTHPRTWEREYTPGLTASIHAPNPTDGWPVWSVEVVLGSLSTYFLCDTQWEAIYETNRVVAEVMLWVSKLKATKDD